MAAPSPPPTSVQTVAPLPPQLTREVNQTGYLESYTVGVTLLVLAGAVITLWVAAGVLRRRRGQRLVPRLPRAAIHVTSGVAVLVLTLAGILVLVNNYVGYVPSLSALFQPPGLAASGRVLHDAANADHSRIVRLSIPAPGDGVASGTTYVYLPPGYDQPAQAGTRYPVVYLFHGYPGRAQDWFTAGRVKSTMDLLIRQHYVGPMIVVSPTASTGYLHDDECLDAPRHFALERYLAFTVVSAIDHTFHTYTDRSHRAIGGMSSGGFCALNIGLHHLHRFSVILASEPYGDPGLHPLTRVLDGNWPLWRANSPSFYIPLLRFSPRVASFLDSGGFDPTAETEALRIAQQLAQRGEEASYRPAPKMHHTWREARAALPYSLIFAWQHFGVMPDGGSDRQDAQQVERILQYALTLPPPAVTARAHASRSPSPSRSPSRSPVPRSSPSPSAPGSGSPPTSTST